MLVARSLVINIWVTEGAPPGIPVRVMGAVVGTILLLIPILIFVPALIRPGVALTVAEGVAYLTIDPLLTIKPAVALRLIAIISRHVFSPASSAAPFFDAFLIAGSRSNLHRIRSVVGGTRKLASHRNGSSSHDGLTVANLKL